MYPRARGAGPWPQPVKALKNFELSNYELKITNLCCLAHKIIFLQAIRNSQFTIRNFKGCLHDNKQ